MIVAATWTVVAIAWRWIGTRPVLDDGELDRARASAGAALRDAESRACPREPLRGAARPGSGRAALRAVFDRSGAHSGCWDVLLAEDGEALFAMSYADGSQEGLAELERDRDPPPAEPDDPPLPERWESHRMGRAVTPTPLAIEERVLAACRETAHAAREALAHEDVCSPFGLGWLEVDFVRVVRLGHVLVAISRDALRRGDPAAGVRALFDGMRLGTDLARGRSTWVATMVGAALIHSMLGQLEMVLAQERAWDEETIRELQREVEVLVRTTPLPDGPLRDDPVTMAIDRLMRDGWEPPVALPRPAGDVPEEDETIWAAREAAPVVMLAAASSLASVRCDPHGSRAACTGRIDEELARARELPAEPPLWRVLLGPRAVRPALEDVTRGLLLTAPASYVRRWEQAALGIAATWLVLEHRALARRERCPRADELGRVELPGSIASRLGGRLEVFETRLPHRPLEISAPGWLRSPDEHDPPRVRLPIARAYCPALALRAEHAAGAP